MGETEEDDRKAMEVRKMENNKAKRKDGKNQLRDVQTYLRTLNRPCLCLFSMLLPTRDARRHFSFIHKAMGRLFATAFKSTRIKLMDDDRN